MSALLLIDFQEFFYQKINKTNFPNFSNNVTEALKMAREKNFHVIHVKCSYKKDCSNIPPYLTKFKTFCSSCVEGEEGDKLCSFTQPLENEKLFEKVTLDVFHKESGCEAELNDYLSKNKINTLYICGMYTSDCVFLSTAGAAQNKYKCYLVEDCCADRSYENHLFVVSKKGFYFEALGYQDIFK